MDNDETKQENDDGEDEEEEDGDDRWCVGDRRFEAKRRAALRAAPPPLVAEDAHRFIISFPVDCDMCGGVFHVLPRIQYTQ